MNSRSQHDCLPPTGMASSIPKDPTPADQAIYVPSISPSYSTDVAKACRAGKWHRELSFGVTPQELSFLGTDTEKPFTLSHVLYSAGQALDVKSPCMILDRNRASSKVIGDSGGYQIATQRKHLNPERDRQRILEWLEETADIAMTLDIPTGPIVNGVGYPYKTETDCLEETIKHLRFFAEKRRENDLILLNVLQGNTYASALHWYDSVKAFKFEGFAIAGPLNKDMYYICRLLLKMLEDKQLEKKKWIHVLGTARLDTAVLLTAIQRALNEIGLNIRISYDTSSPSLAMARNDAYTFPDFGPNNMTYRTVKAPSGYEYHDCELRWPWPSTIGDRLRMKDMCVDYGTGHRNTTQRDGLGNHLLTLHNLQAICFAIATANRIIDGEYHMDEPSIGRNEAKAAKAIRAILKSGSLQTLYKHSSTFAALKGSKNAGVDDFTSEELRDFCD